MKPAASVTLVARLEHAAAREIGVVPKLRLVELYGVSTRRPSWSPALAGVFKTRSDPPAIVRPCARMLWKRELWVCESLTGPSSAGLVTWLMARRNPPASAEQRA